MRVRVVLVVPAVPVRMTVMPAHHFGSIGRDDRYRTRHGLLLQGRGRAVSVGVFALFARVVGTALVHVLRMSQVEPVLELLRQIEESFLLGLSPGRTLAANDVVVVFVCAGRGKKAQISKIGQKFILRSKHSRRKEAKGMGEEGGWRERRGARESPCLSHRGIGLDFGFLVCKGVNKRRGDQGPRECPFETTENPNDAPGSSQTIPY